MISIGRNESVEVRRLRRFRRHPFPIESKHRTTSFLYAVVLLVASLASLTVDLARTCDTLMVSRTQQHDCLDMVG